ncbi:MAG TPA: hypothetical protein VHH88_07370, partial [Verrucomicrobiae bacterium]|nr:hypothetical protein [Verrucomicrobiae bacterium]
MRPRDLVSALVAALLAGVFSAKAASWEAALGSMPLPPGTRILTRSNCVPLMLDAFQSNDVVKALVFMPGATDEFYMFHRATARLTNAA